MGAFREMRCTIITQHDHRCRRCSQFPYNASTANAVSDILNNIVFMLTHFSVLTLLTSYLDIQNNCTSLNYAANHMFPKWHRFRQTYDFLLSATVVQAEQDLSISWKWLDIHISYIDVIEGGKAKRHHTSHKNSRNTFFEKCGTFKLPKKNLNFTIK